MRCHTAGVVLVCLIGAGERAYAERWCSTDHPNAIFCDDFDRYCHDAPLPPEECPPGASESIGAIRGVWFRGSCGTELNPEPLHALSSPFSAKYPCQEDAQLGQQTVYLITRIHSAFGSEYTAVRGTDANPLTLEFAFHGQSLAQVSHANAYMELSMTSDRAPTDYVYGPACDTYCAGGGPTTQSLMLCQQEFPPAGCPAMPGPLHASIAVGSVAFLDTDPCHCNDPGNQKPSSTHLAFFDGDRWYALRAGLFPGQGDFLLSGQVNSVVMTIRSSTIRVELTAGATSWCEIPRAYFGAFEALRIGFGQSCLIDLGSWSCLNQSSGDYRYRCKRGALGAGGPFFDNISLDGGEGFVLPGACCLPDASCAAISPEDCHAQGGELLSGTCAESVCCLPGFPDSDADGICGDVDNCASEPNPGQEDDDGDELGNACDNCPGVPNLDQANDDTDSHGNACDNCPGTANEDQLNTDGDALGNACDPDMDNDGLLNGDDNCPINANAGQSDADGDGAGDACDACPETIPGMVVDASGCPQAFIGDLDLDGDVDLKDFGRFQSCLTGASVPVTDPNCMVARLDGDGDIDPDDMLLFLSCISGPNVPARASCVAGP